eukprot:s3405_g3.t1
MAMLAETPSRLSLRRNAADGWKDIATARENEELTRIHGSLRSKVCSSPLSLSRESDAETDGRGGKMEAAAAGCEGELRAGHFPCPGLSDLHGSPSRVFLIVVVHRNRTIQKGKRTPGTIFGLEVAQLPLRATLSWRSDVAETPIALLSM